MEFLSNKYAEQIISDLKPDYKFHNIESYNAIGVDGCVAKISKNSIYIGRIGFWIVGGKPHGPGIYVCSLSMRSELRWFIEHSNPNLISLINDYIDEIARKCGV